ncbi:MAG: hypothetical protein U5K75_10210 [Ahrensia sp.]|nr:hypothetical protein [Ahrensia sp.]
MSIGAASAQTVEVVPTEGMVRAVIQTPRGSYVETERGTYLISSCSTGICLKPDVVRGRPKRAPDGALPDGFVATSNKGAVRKAWYGRPTDRYAHCVLGDCIEGGSLIVELADGGIREFVLPTDQVFEDISPRVDGDFVITIRSSNKGGAAVVVYTLKDGNLIEAAASTEIGRSNRWLSIASVIDGVVTFVRTPHIGGRLATLKYDEAGEPQERSDLVTNISNHFIGSRILNMSASVVSKSTTLLAIPSQSRDALRLIETPDIIRDVPLPGKIDKAIIAFDGRVITSTDDGQLLVITP